MKRGSQNYFEKDLSAPSDLTEEIVFCPAQYSPMVATALFTRISRAFWATEEDWAQGYYTTSTIIRNLFMGGIEDLITEIRDTRGLKPDAPAPPPDGFYPIGTFPGFQFKDLYQQATDANLNREAEHTEVMGKLEEVRQAILETSGDPAEQLELLQAIALFLGAV